MPTKRKRRFRPAVQRVTDTEWYWLTGEEIPGADINEFELDLSLRHPVHRREIKRALELLTAYPVHARHNHPGLVEELRELLAQRKREACNRHVLPETEGNTTTI